MNRFKRFLSLFLALTMVFSIVPFSAFADDDNIGRPEDGTTEGQPFASGTGGSTYFRIPALVTLSDGTLVAAADARWNHTGDRSNIDILVSYSKDMGENWNYAFADYIDDPDGLASSENTKAATFMDSGLAVKQVENEETGETIETIYLLVDLFPGQTANANCITQVKQGTGYDDDGYLKLSTTGYTASDSYDYYLKDKAIYDYATNTDQGYTVDAWFNVSKDGESLGNLFNLDQTDFYPLQTSYLCLTTGTMGEDGIEWSEPMMLNSQVKTSSDYFLGVGPGAGLVTSTGRIIFPCYTYASADGNTNIIYSDDNGETWSRVQVTTDQTSEATLTEADGTIYLFTRHGGYYYSTDDGATWSTKQTASGISYTTSCQLSSLTYSQEIDGQTAILLSVPTSDRTTGKIFVGLVNEDKSITWKYAYSVNGSNTYQYSSMAELSDGNIALLYESGAAAITYTTIDIDDIVSTATDVYTDRQTVELSLGDTVTYTVTGDYSTADVSDLDTDVAAVSLSATEETVVSANLGSDNTYSGDTINLDKCQYTFTQSGDTWTIQAADGSSIYLYPGNGSAGYPNTASAYSQMNIEAATGDGADEDSFYLYSPAGTAKKGYLYFDRSALNLNRVDTVEGNTTYQANCSMRLYQKVEGEGSEEIPGYERITSVDDIDSGSNYIIVAPGSDGNLYALYPNTATTNTYCQIAKIGDASEETVTKVTFTAQGVGESMVQVGSVIYDVSVSEGDYTYTDDTGVTVTVGRSSGVTHIHTVENTSLTNTRGKFVAYDVLLCTGDADDCADGQADTCVSYYEGVATVTIPLGTALDGCVNPKAFVVEADGSLTYISRMDLDTDSGTATFESPHFSTVGVDAQEVTETVEVEVGLGNTVTLTQEPATAEYGSNNIGLDSAAIAAATWTGTTYATAYPGIDGGFSDTASLDVSGCMYTFDKQSDNTYIISASTATTADGETIYLMPYDVSNSANHNTTTPVEVTVSNGTADSTIRVWGIDPDNTAKNGSLHFHADETYPYWNQCGSDSTYKHDLLLYRPIQGTESSSAEIPGFIQIDAQSEIVDDGQYLVVAKSDAGDYYIMVPTTDTTHSRTQIAKISGDTAQRDEDVTTVEITGEAVGTTSLLVGTVLYNISVVDNTRYLEVYVGQTIHTTVPGDVEDGSNTDAYADASWVHAAYESTTSDLTDSYAVSDTAVEKGELKAGTYLICIHGGNYALTTYAGTTYTNGRAAKDNGKVAITQNMWTLEDAGDGKFYIKNSAGYLSLGTANNYATLDANSGDAFTITYNDTDGAWYIANDNDLYAINLNASNEVGGFTNANNGFDFYAVNEYSDVTITGTTAGTSTFSVGEIKFEVEVLPTPEKNITVYAGSTVTITDDTGAYAVEAEDSVASVSAEAVYNNITTKLANHIESGKQYAILFRRYSNSVTDTKYLKSAGTDSALTLTETIDKSAIWTVINCGSGDYQIVDTDGNYLELGSNSAKTVAAATDGGNKIDLYFFNSTTGNGSTWYGNWVIGEVTADNSTYYLHDLSGVPQGYNPGGANRWGHMARFYEITSDTAVKTSLTIEGLTEGTTSVMVGYTQYNITVVEEDVNVKVPVDGSKTVTVDGVAYTDETVDITDDNGTQIATMQIDGTVEYTADTTAATSIEDGAKYIIVSENAKGAGAANQLVTNDDSGSALALAGTVSSFTDAAVWTFTEVSTGTYKVQDLSGKYLNIKGQGTSELSDDAIVLKLGNSGCANGTFWTIMEESETYCYLNDYKNTHTLAGGWNEGAATNHGSHWYLYKVEETAYTEFTITGVAAGETTETVGHVNFNIEVVEPEQVTIDMQVGDVVEKTDESGYYVDMVLTDSMTGIVASAEVVGTKNVTPTNVTTLTAGEYMICLTLNGYYAMTTGTNDGWPYGRALVQSETTEDGKLVATSANTWTLEDAGNNQFYIKSADGKYLDLSGDTAALGDTKVAFTIETNSDGYWTIKESDSMVLNNLGGTTNTQALGGYGSNAVPLYLYQVPEEDGTTDITFTGLTVGTTVVTVGYTEYTVNVSEPDDVKIEVHLHEGASVTYTDIAGIYDTYTNSDDTVVGVEINQDTATNKTEITLTGLSIGDDESSATATVTVGYVTYNITIYKHVHEVYLLVGGSATYSVEADIWTGLDETEETYVGLEILNGKLNITALAEGTAEFKVGHIYFDVHVSQVAVKEKDITLYVGRTYSLTDEDGNFADNYSLDGMDTTKASVTVSGGTSSSSSSVSEISDGHQYYIQNVATGGYLTAVSNGTGLTMIDEITGNGDKALWNVKKADDGVYYLYHIVGDYLNVTAGEAGVVTDLVDPLVLYYTGTVWTITDTQGNVLTVLDDGDAYGVGMGTTSTASAQWQFHELGNGYTDLTFKGVAEGTTSVTIGYTKYNIEVKDINSEEIDGAVDTISTPVLSATGRYSGNVVTRLTISEGMSYTLTLVSDLADADVVWSSENTAVATVSNGTITAVSAGTTNILVTATMDLDGDGEKETTQTYKIPVTVLEKTTSTNTDTVDIYINEITNTTLYYSIDCSDTLVQTYEGEAFYLTIDDDADFAIDFFGKSDDGYALTYLDATEGQGHYMRVTTDEDGNPAYTVNDDGTITYYPASAEFITKYKAAGWCQIDAGFTTVEDMVEAAMVIGTQGGLGFTRYDDLSEGGVYSSLTVRSQKLPTVTKSIVGVLGEEQMADSYRAYTEGMTATTGEWVFYAVTVTKYAEEIQIDYTDVYLEDTLEGAYFVVASGKGASGTGMFGPYDPTHANGNPLVTLVDADGNLITDKDAPTKLNLTTQLADWNTDENSVTIYAIYQIQEDDVIAESIINNVDLTYDYAATYQNGEYSGTANAEATMKVTNFKAKDVIVDFGLPVQVECTGVTGMAGDYVDGYIAPENFTGTEQSYSYTVYGEASYGVVEIVPELAAAVAEETDAQSNILSLNLDLTYTPNTVLKKMDQVTITLKINSKNDRNTEDTSDDEWVCTTTVYNLIVYPATTVYYEEVFGAFSGNGWTLSDIAYDDDGNVLTPAQMELPFQQCEYAEYDENDYEDYDNFGYDKAYALDNETVGASNASEAVSANAGDRAVFEFTGTGFELYANCTPETGAVTVLVSDSNNTLVKVYQVDTKTGSGTTNTTSGQADLTAYSLPIISARKLEYGSYVVTVIHSRRNSTEATQPIKLDGIRVFDTMNTINTGAYAANAYNNTGEKNPVFIQMRDQMLYVYGVGSVTDSQYMTGTELLEQVYEANVGSNATADMVILSSGVETQELKDLLDNGPKNEIYLYPGQALSFTLNPYLSAQIGLKAVDGIVTYSLNGGDNAEMNTSTDMFYTIGSDTVGSKVSCIITNATDSKGILSITLLKVSDGDIAVLDDLDQDGTAEAGEKVELDEIFTEPDVNTLTRAARTLGIMLASEEPEEDPSIETPSTEETESTEAPSTEETEEPATQATETPATEETEAPSTEATEAPTTDVTVDTEDDETSSIVNNPFTDVKEGDYYYDAVLWAVGKKVTTGMTETEFAPLADCTRAHIVTFLWRASGEPKASSDNNPFTDVAEGTFYYDAVLWAVEKGITTGVTETTFEPDRVCTRGEAVTFLWRSQGKSDAAAESSSFTDVDVNAYYYPAVQWAVSNMVTLGTTETTFSPAETCKRGQIVTFLWRALK